MPKSTVQLVLITAVYSKDAKRHACRRCPGGKERIPTRCRAWQSGHLMLIGLEEPALQIMECKWLQLLLPHGVLMVQIKPWHASAADHSMPKVQIMASPPYNAKC
eukprot:1155333-Pelagomonas_calceolata.AAC.10